MKHKKRINDIIAFVTSHVRKGTLYFPVLYLYTTINSVVEQNTI